jgi:glucose repression regulatory protein TUP1
MMAAASDDSSNSNIHSAQQQLDSGITSLAISPSGKIIAAGSLDRTIRLWDAVDGTLLETLEGHRDSVYSVAFSPDGKSLVSGSLDKTIKVWQLDQNAGSDSHAAGAADTMVSVPQKSTCKYTILGHKDYVLSVAVTLPDSRWIVSGSKDRSVQFWDSQSGTTQLMLQGHKNSVISVAVCPAVTLQDKQQPMIFATGSGDSRVRIWSYQYMTAGEGDAPVVAS